MKKHFKWVLLALWSMSSISSASVQTKIQHKNASKKEAYLFVQSAEEATLKRDKVSSFHTLTLKNMPKFVTYFSDRPARNAGSFPLQKFLNFWKYSHHNGFKSNPPNAVISGTKVGASDKVIYYPVELLEPKQDKATHALTFKVLPLKGGPRLPKEITLHHAVLFIDDACLSCWN